MCKRQQQFVGRIIPTAGKYYATRLHKKVPQIKIRTDKLLVRPHLSWKLNRILKKIDEILLRYSICCTFTPRLRDCRGSTNSHRRTLCHRHTIIH